MKLLCLQVVVVFSVPSWVALLSAKEAMAHLSNARFHVNAFHYRIKPLRTTIIRDKLFLAITVPICATPLIWQSSEISTAILCISFFYR